MIANVIVNLESNGYIPKKLFKQLFKKELKQIFRKEINFLINNGLIRENHNYFEIISTNRIEQFIYSKIFYERIILDRFRKFIKMCSKAYNNVDFDLLCFYDL